MAEYITKGQALQAVRDAVDAKDEAIHAIEMHIDALTVVDVVPVVHAYWIGIEGDGYAEDENGETQIIYEVFECSNCGCEHRADGEPEWAYCPDCGAKMDLEPPIWESKQND